MRFLRITDEINGNQATVRADEVAEAIKPWFDTDPEGSDAIMREVMGIIDDLQRKILEGGNYDGEMAYLCIRIEGHEDSEEEMLVRYLIDAKVKMARAEKAFKEAEHEMTVAGMALSAAQQDLDNYINDKSKENA